MIIRCAHCKKKSDKPAGQVTRARNAGLKLYCDRRCSGLGRRDGRTKAERVEAKRLYDLAYRAKNLDWIKAKKRDHFKRTYDPVKAAVERQKNMPRHVEYCRRPEYKRWKKGYDRNYRAKKDFGPFAEAAMVLSDLNFEINGRGDRHEIRYQNGGTNKAQRREREARQGPSRNRHSTANR